MEAKKEVKKCKQSVNILHIAATDKENLTSRINKNKMELNKYRTICTRKNKKNTALCNNAVVKKNINALIDQSTQSDTILESDLTVDNPSEDYWKKLAQSNQSALETALKENMDLHNKVIELEYENSRLKTMLDEAKSLVQVLTEMIEEKSSDVDESINCDKDLDESKEVSDSDSENVSFQSCI